MQSDRKPSKKEERIKIMKRIVSLVLLLCLAFSLAACTGTTENPTTEPQRQTTAQPTTEQEPQGEVSTPLFWKVSGNGYEGEFYLLGSIHVGTDDTNNYPKQILDAFEKCAALAVEGDIVEIEKDTAALIESMKPFVYSDGTTIKDHIDKELYDDAVALMTELGIYNFAMDYYKPTFWDSMISSMLADMSKNYKIDNGVDRWFLNKAKKTNKDIIELEDYKKTYADEAALSDKTQELILESDVHGFETDDYVKEYEESIKKLFDAWKKGDLTKMEEILFTEADESEYTEEEIKCAEEYNKFIMTDRNAEMVKKALDFLKNGKSVFYVVGEAHMLGDDGLVNKLTEAGYTVELVKFD